MRRRNRNQTSNEFSWRRGTGRRSGRGRKEGGGGGGKNEAMKKKTILEKGWRWSIAIARHSCVLFMHVQSFECSQVLCRECDYQMWTEVHKAISAFHSIQALHQSQRCRIFIQMLSEPAPLLLFFFLFFASPIPLSSPFTLLIKWKVKHEGQATYSKATVFSLFSRRTPQIYSEAIDISI